MYTSIGNTQWECLWEGFIKDGGGCVRSGAVVFIIRRTRLILHHYHRCHSFKYYYYILFLCYLIQFLHLSLGFCASKEFQVGSSLPIYFSTIASKIEYLFKYITIFSIIGSGERDVETEGLPGKTKSK